MNYTEAQLASTPPEALTGRQLAKPAAPSQKPRVFRRARAHSAPAMMNSRECRERAREADARAAATPDPVLKANYESLAREWAALAITSDIEDRLQANLLGRSGDVD